MENKKQDWSERLTKVLEPKLAIAALIKDSARNYTLCRNETAEGHKAAMELYTKRLIEELEDILDITIL